MLPFSLDYNKVTYYVKIMGHLALSFKSLSELNNLMSFLFWWSILISYVISSTKCTLWKKYHRLVLELILLIHKFKKRTSSDIYIGLFAWRLGQMQLIKTINNEQFVFRGCSPKNASATKKIITSAQPIKHLQ